MHRPRRILRLLPLLALLLVLALAAPARAASAGKAAYEQGVADYHAKRNTQAVADFEQAIAQGYHPAAVYYMLGLTFSRLKQWSYAVWAFDTVQNADPAYASSHPTLARELAHARAKGGVDQGPPPGVTAGATSPGTSGNPGAGPGAPQASAIASILTTNAVYVDPALQSAVGNDGLTTLQGTANDLKQHSSTTVRFAFISAVPAPYSSLGTYAYALFARLGFSRAVVIVASPHGVAARTDRLSDSQTQDLVSASTPQFLQGSYTQGADSLARAIVAKADSNDASATRTRIITVLVIVVLIAGAIALFIGVRASRWRSAYNEAVAWRDSLSQTITETSDHVNYLPDDHPAKRTFLTASAYYSTASTIIDQLATAGPLQAAFGGSRHRNALGQARSSLQAAERTLQQAEAEAGGKQADAGATVQGAPGGEIAPPAEFADRASGAAVPAACFFCAMPLDASRAQVVSVPTPNGTRRVMACDEHAADVKAGRQPAIRAVPDPDQGGRLTPWWGVPSYDPYRDYRYDPYYYRGGGIGWGDLLLFDALFNQPRDTIIYADDDDRGWGGDQTLFTGYDGSRPDSASFDSGGRDMPSAAEADWGGGSGGFSGGDQS